MIHGLGAERTFVPTALCVDLCGGASGQVETTWVRGGPGPVRRSRILNTLNEILVFDLSLATSLYALTIYAGVVMGIPASWYQPKHFRRQRRSGARRIGT